MISKVKKIFFFIFNYLRFTLFYRWRGIHVHPSSHISFKATLLNPGNGVIKIGKECEIHRYSVINSYGGQIELGDNVSLNSFSLLYGNGGLIIKNGVRIAPHSIIVPANHVIGDLDLPLHKRGLTTKGIVIEENVWIGAGCQILDGVTLGGNSVVAAGALVNKSFPKNVLLAGVPSKVIKVLKQS